MASVKELLLNSLKELEESDLKEFQWHLKDKYLPKSGIEKADILKTVDKMVAHFKEQKAVNITVEILRKLNQNSVVEQLENEYKQGNVLFLCFMFLSFLLTCE